MMDPEDEAAHEKGAKLAPAQHSARVHLPTSAPTSVSQRMSATATCTSIISQPAAGVLSGSPLRPNSGELPRRGLLPLRGPLLSRRTRCAQLRRIPYPVWHI